MKYIILVLSLFLATPAFGQSAREDMKKDPVIAAINLSDEELDKMVSMLKQQAEQAKKDALLKKAMKRMEKMLSDNPGLAQRLMNE